MDMQKFYSICMQGNVLKAIEYLQTFEDSKDNDNDIIMLKRQYPKRFLSNNEIYKINSDDSWVKDVINCYFNYFRSVLTNHSVKDAENDLAANLSALVTVGNSDLDNIESELKNIFKEKGYSFLGGVTPPYRGPYIWKTTIKKEFDVELPDSSQKVTVYFISDFLMLSWMHFATMGNHYAGGWAASEGLYYVDAGSEHIDVNSAKFQVWFLKHEAQHLSDYKRFPNLNARNLEYRAKLIELIYNPDPYSLIEKFLNESKNDNTLPHPYAAYSIIRKLSSLIFGQEYAYDKEQWKNIECSLISDTAFRLFLQNNKNLCEAGNETEGII